MRTLTLEGSTSSVAAHPCHKVCLDQDKVYVLSACVSHTSNLSIKLPSLLSLPCAVPKRRVLRQDSDYPRISRSSHCITKSLSSWTHKQTIVITTTCHPVGHSYFNPMKPAVWPSPTLPLNNPSPKLSPSKM